MIIACAVRAALMSTDSGRLFPWRAAALAAAKTRLKALDSCRSEAVSGAVVGERSAACTTRKKALVWDSTAASAIALARGAYVLSGFSSVAPCWGPVRKPPARPA